MSTLHETVSRWVNEMHAIHMSQGLSVSVNETESPGSIAVNMDSKNTRSAAIIWDQGNAELVIIDAKEGSTVLIKEVKQINETSICSLLNDWVETVRNALPSET